MPATSRVYRVTAFSRPGELTTRELSNSLRRSLSLMNYGDMDEAMMMSHRRSPKVQIDAVMMTIIPMYALRPRRPGRVRGETGSSCPTFLNEISATLCVNPLRAEFSESRFWVTIAEGSWMSHAGNLSSLNIGTFLRCWQGSVESREVNLDLLSRVEIECCVPVRNLERLPRGVAD